jgi:Uma2 family endonuclease
MVRDISQSRSRALNVAEYLVAEAGSVTRHEYLGGERFALAGETCRHNLIVGNLCIRVRRQLKRIGGRVFMIDVRVFMIDVRVNFHLRTDEYYYYPDLVVTCDKRDNHPRFVRYPKLIIEVLSESTERVDKREKFFAYTNIPSLAEYVLVAQTSAEVTVFRRANDWKAEKVLGPKARVLLESLKLTIPLKAIYEGV